MAVRHRKLPKRATQLDSSTAAKAKDELNKDLVSSRRNTKFILLSSIGVAVILAALQYHVLFSLFENDRHFSFLSELEREMSFRTEMGLYYSYYKTIVSAPTFQGGVAQITTDNVTEYPSVINTLQRFNLAPEVVVGGAYRLFQAVMAALGVTDRTCFSVNRGEGIPPVESCEGLDEPIYFYVTAIFVLNGCYLSVMFLMSVYVSGSFLGGVLGALAFVYNLTEVTRVMWTPPLRESFATPFLFIQLTTLSFIIRNRKTGFKWAAILSAPTLAFLLPWQFAQFVMVMQCLIVGTMAAFNLLNVGVFRTVIAGVSLAFVANVALQYGNAMLMTSYLPASLVALWLAILVQTSGLLRCLPFPALAGVVQTAVCLATVAGVKLALSAATGQQDDAHIGSLLIAKFSGYTDFHTQMYLCAREFDFMELELLYALTLTLLLPTAVLGVVLVIRQVLPVAWRQLWQWNSCQDDTTINRAAELSYHLLQLLAFTVLAVLVMRLKLFFTPYLCLFAAMAASTKLMDFLSRKWHLLLVLILIGCSSWQGSANVTNMMSIEGEFSDLPQEEMINWIKFNTPNDAVFAGAMPVMATVKLSTGRPIVNHPHYEHREVRERTEKVYQLYSRKPPEVVHHTLQGMGVNLAVVEGHWCHWRSDRPGCTFGEVWDMIDPAHKGQPLFCEEVLAGSGQLTPPPFQLVFQNTHYSILRVQ